MESLKELYRIGPGPSSSHTLAIKRICEKHLKTFPEDTSFEVTLYGSLALTGKGHMTDKIILDTLGEERTVIHFDPQFKKHPNTMVIHSGDHEATYYSTGGGAYQIEGEPFTADPRVYPESTMKEIMDYCFEYQCSLYEYVVIREPGIERFLEKILDQMFKTVEQGISLEGILPGKLKLQKMAKSLYEDALREKDPAAARDLFITAFAYACSEENASGHTVVTAPTLGSCGVLPAVLYWYYRKGTPKEKIIEALAVAGIFGNLIKTNASISGAEGGCQAEIGTACAMAAAAAGWIGDLSDTQITYAAEIGIEHNLGLTCDPVEGYVQIPCIERNGVAAIRAVNAYEYADHLGSRRPNRVSFDMVVKTMNYTGKKIARELRETSLGGLAEVVK